MPTAFEVEHVIRIHVEGEGMLEVGTDPDTSSCVQIRTAKGDKYFGPVILTLPSKQMADALASAILDVANTLK